MQRTNNPDQFQGAEIVSTRNGVESAIGIGRLPGRKSIMLYLRHQGTITTVATIRDTAHAEAVKGWLEKIVGGWKNANS